MYKRQDADGCAGDDGTMETLAPSMPLAADAASGATGVKGQAAARRGQSTELFKELMAKASPERPTHAVVLAKPSKQKATRSDGQRPVRRGELEGVAAKYAGIQDLTEFKLLCEALTERRIKKREIEEAYHRGKIVSNPGSIFDHVYGRPDKNDRSKFRILPGAWKTLTEADVAAKEPCDDKMLLGLDAEEFMVHLIVRCHRRKKGLTEQEIKTWARSQVCVCLCSVHCHATSVGHTDSSHRSSAAPIRFSQIQKAQGRAYRKSLKAWYPAFLGRASRLWGVDLEAKLTQQQSAGRAAVTEATINEFKSDVVDPLLAEPDSALLTLNHIGNGDEWWLDLNKLLQAVTVGPKGEEHRQETPSERSAHITIFSGAAGYESSPEERAAARAGVPVERDVNVIGPSLSESQRALLNSRPASLDELQGNDDDLLTDSETAWLEKLSLDTWDSPFFFVYPVLVILARSTGPDDSWTKHCKSDKMLGITTSDGWMDEDSKLKWYRCAKTFPHSPFARSERFIDQRDQHYSNESIPQSVEQEADDNIGLATPGHHTAALQQMDQRGGPIQHANRILRTLVRREHRAKGTLEIPRLFRLIEIAVAASHTPKIFSYAQRRVGWYEDGHGKLCYDPMATCDKSVLTAYVPPPQAANAGVSGALQPASQAFQLGTSAGPSEGSMPGAYRKTNAFLAEHSSAAQLAASTVKELFTSVISDSSDEESGCEGEEHDRKRRKKGGGRKCAKGTITSRAEARAKKHERDHEKKQKLQKAKDDACKEYTRVQGVIEQWGELTSKHTFLIMEHSAETVATKLTVPEMKVYLEMRMKKKPPAALSKASAIELVHEHVGVETYLREGNIPDGYSEWKEKERERLLLTQSAAGTTPLLTFAPNSGPAKTAPLPVAQSPRQEARNRAAEAMRTAAAASTPRTRAILLKQADEISK